MIPSSYTVGNFKAIGSPQTVSLRPITLIFGQNSAGKSSIIQSLLLSRFAMENGSFHFTSAKRWGQTIDLGGFRQYVHRHETDRDLTLCFEFRRSRLERESSALDSQVSRKASARAKDQLPPDWSFSFLNSLEKVSIRFLVGIAPPEWKSRSVDDQPIVKELEIDGDGKPLLSFSLDRSGGLQLAKLSNDSPTLINAIAELVIAYRKKLVTDGETEEQSLEELAKSLGPVPVEEKAFQEVLDHVAAAYDAAGAAETPPPEVLDLLLSSEAMGMFVWIVTAQLADELKTPGRALHLEGSGLDYRIKPSARLDSSRLQVVAPPGGGKAEDTGTFLGDAVELEAIEYPVSFFCDEPGEPDTAAALARALRFDIEMLIDAIFESLRWWLIGTEYIGPHRSIPDRYFQIAKSETSQEVDQGYQTLRRIAENPQLLRRISDAFQEIMGSPYRLEVRKIAPSVDFAQLEEKVQRYLEIEASKTNADVKSGIRDVMASATAGRVMKGVYLVDTRNGTDVDFCDVGFGIGQVLPLLAEVASQRCRLVCIEQPEAQLHPKMQSDLADVFLQDIAEDGTAVARSLFILETHSEHLILRLLRRIRETTRKKLPERIGRVTPDYFSVVWVEAGKEGSIVTPLAVSKQGQFVDEWPSGFFEERLDEMFD
jgi:GTPase SAR1 family protein